MNNAVFTEEIEKTVLSANDDKKNTINSSIETYIYIYMHMYFWALLISAASQYCTNILDTLFEATGKSFK